MALGRAEDTKIVSAVLVLTYGEVSEWLKEQPWKGCVWLVCTAGSNPALSVAHRQTINLTIDPRIAGFLSAPGFFPLAFSPKTHIKKHPAILLISKGLEPSTFGSIG